jgi:hypothetical protein
MIPWQGLIGSDGAIFKLPNKGMDTDLSATGSTLIPMIVVLVLSQYAIIWSNVSTKIGIIGPSTVDHNALGFNFPAYFITFVFCKDKFFKVHRFSLLQFVAIYRKIKTPQAWPMTLLLVHRS